MISSANLTGIAATDNVRTGILDVAGVGTFRNDVNIPDKIIHLGDTNTAIRFPVADTVTVETGGSERSRFDSSPSACRNKSGVQEMLVVVQQIQTQQIDYCQHQTIHLVFNVIS